MSYMKCPNMEAARLKIAAVLKEHDLMGAVLIASKERSGFFHELSPSWSCATVDESKPQVEVRVRCKREDFPSAEAQNQALALTVNGLMGLLHVHPYTEQMLSGIIRLIGQKVDFTSMASDERIQEARAGDG